jgi:hypothetical protein
MSYCLNCSGSGEGMFDGSRCMVCKGTGSDPRYKEEEDMQVDTEQIEWINSRVLPDADTTLLLYSESEGDIFTGYFDSVRKMYISNLTKQPIKDVGAWAVIEGP